MKRPFLAIFKDYMRASMKNKNMISQEELAMRKHIGENLFKFRKAEKKLQAEYADLFKVSLPIYQQWETHGPSVYNINFWIQYSKLAEFYSKNNQDYILVA